MTSWITGELFSSQSCRATRSVPQFYALGLRYNSEASTPQTQYMNESHAVQYIHEVHYCNPALSSASCVDESRDQKLNILAYYVMRAAPHKCLFMAKPSKLWQPLGICHAYFGYRTLQMRLTSSKILVQLTS